jgi:hypothetical protein
MSEHSPETHLLDLSFSVSNTNAASFSAIFYFSSHSPASDSHLKSVCLALGTRFSVSVVSISRPYGQSWVSRDWTTFAVSVYRGLSNDFSLSGVDVRSLPKDSAAMSDSVTFALSLYLGANGFFSLSVIHNGSLAENTGMNWLSTSFSVSMYLKASHSSSLSVVGISRFSENSGMRCESRSFSESISLRGSRSFSLSVIDMNRLSRSCNLIEISVTLANSAIRPKNEVLASRSAVVIQTSLGAWGSGLGSSIWHVTLLAETGSASSAGQALALGIGLGVGLLSLILFVVGSIVWFSTRRKVVILDFTEPSEFATDFIDEDDPWDEDVRMVSGENVLASEPIIMDVPFTEPAMMEESLWVN